MSQSSDIKHRFLFDGTDIRGEIVTLNDSHQTILNNNDLPFSVQQLLGEMVAAASLMCGRLKFEGQLTVQAQGNGPVSMIMAECTHMNTVRAIARLNDDIDPACLGEAPDIRSILGEAVLVITIDPEQGERYQGIVPLSKSSLSDCLEEYFQQSEQLETRIWLTADKEKSAGLMLQRLPQQEITSEEELQDHWDTAVALASTVTGDELRQIGHSELLIRLFHELSPRVFEPQSVKFECSCSRERCANALQSVGRQEVEKMLAESPQIDINCQFCNAHYSFDESDLDSLFAGEPGRLH